MLIKYVHHKFRNDSLELIALANQIIKDMSAQGYDLTLRQLYYQFVARDLIENSERSYKRIGAMLNKARLSGLVSWYAIEDRGRHCTRYSFQEDEHEVLNGLQYGVNIDHWARQDTYIEAWVEKDALIGVLKKPCERYDVPHMACKGYVSASEAWRAGRRFKQKREEGKNCVLIHLGDHDPSGLDMTRDNRDRLTLFSESNGVEVIRLALNMDQIEELKPPPNPAKLTDSRCGGYISQYGKSSWELDALDPKYIDNIVTNEIEKHIDFDEWERCTDIQEERRQYLSRLYGSWDEVKDFLDENGL